MKKVFFLLPLLIFFVTIPLIKYWNINWFSLNYLWHTPVDKSFREESQFPVLKEHKRVWIWLAQSDLFTKNYDFQNILALLAASNDPMAERMYANSLFAQGDNERAITIWEQIRDNNSLLSAGDALVERDDYAGAQKAYLAAQTIEPQKAADRLVSLLLWNKNSPEEAEKMIRNLLNIYPKSIYRLNWLRYLADSLRLQRRFDEAIVYYQQVIVENPEDWAAYSGLGWSCYERGDGFQAAMDYLNEAVILNTSTGEADFAVAEILVREKRYKEADAWYARSIDRSPDNRWMYIARANALSTGGDLAGADRVYQETAERFPSYVPNYCYMAWNYRLMDQRSESVETIKKASVIGGEKGMPSWCNLTGGWIFEWAGEKEQAIRSFEKVLTVEPGNSEALEGINRLKR